MYAFNSTLPVKQRLNAVPITFIRLAKTDKTSRTNLIRFRRRAIVEFNCFRDLELNSSELIEFDDSAAYKLGPRYLLSVLWEWEWEFAS